MLLLIDFLCWGYSWPLADRSAPLTDAAGCQLLTKDELLCYSHIPIHPLHCDLLLSLNRSRKTNLCAATLVCAPAITAVSETSLIGVKWTDQTLLCSPTMRTQNRITKILTQIPRCSNSIDRRTGSDSVNTCTHLYRGC